MERLAHSHAPIEPALETFAAGDQKVHGPAVQIHTVDEVSLALGWFAEMLPARVVGIRERAVSTAVRLPFSSPSPIRATMVNWGAGVSIEHQLEASCVAALHPAQLSALKPLDQCRSVVMLDTCKLPSATGLTSFVQPPRAGLPLS